MLPPGELEVLAPYRGHALPAHYVRYPSTRNHPSPKAVRAKPFTTLPLLTSSVDISYPLLTSLAMSLPHHCHVICLVPLLTSFVLRTKISCQNSFFSIKREKWLFFIFFATEQCSRHKRDRVRSSSFTTASSSEKSQQTPQLAIQTT